MATDAQKGLIKEAIERALLRWVRQAEKGTARSHSDFATDLYGDFESMELAGDPVRIIQGDVFRLGDIQTDYRDACATIKICLVEVRKAENVDYDKAAANLIARLANSELYISRLEDP